MRICEGGGFFFRQESRDFLAEFVGVFLWATTLIPDGRFCSASTSFDARLWIMVCSSLSGGGRGSGDAACVTGNGNQEGPAVCEVA